MCSLRKRLSTIGLDGFRRELASELVLEENLRDEGEAVRSPSRTGLRIRKPPLYPAELRDRLAFLIANHTPRHSAPQDVRYCG
jgi:hypothetical protein